VVSGTFALLVTSSLITPSKLAVIRVYPLFLHAVRHGHPRPCSHCSTHRILVDGSRPAEVANGLHGLLWRTEPSAGFLDDAVGRRQGADGGQGWLDGREGTAAGVAAGMATCRVAPRTGLYASTAFRCFNRNLSPIPLSPKPFPVRRPGLPRCCTLSLLEPLAALPPRWLASRTAQSLNQYGTNTKCKRRGSRSFISSGKSNTAVDTKSSLDVGSSNASLKSSCAAACRPYKCHLYT